MPTYEYQCKSCNHRFEIWQKMVDEPLTVCPECQGTIRRILFPAGIVFKGSGFYKTDHGNGTVLNENNHSEQKEKESASKTEGTSETTTSKSETTTAGPGKSAAPASESKTSAAAD